MIGGVDVEAFSEPLEGHQVLVLDRRGGRASSGSRRRSAGPCRARTGCRFPPRAQPVVARDGGVRESRHARARGGIEVVLACSDAAARPESPSSACRRRCRGASGARSRSPGRTSHSRTRRPGGSPLVSVHWSAAAGAASEAGGAADQQERAGQPTEAGGRGSRSESVPWKPSFHDHGDVREGLALGRRVRTAGAAAGAGRRPRPGHLLGDQLASRAPRSPRCRGCSARGRRLPRPVRSG